MIKNILYSLFIHFILFSAIYFAFIKKNNKEIEAEQEILVSVITLDNKGVPPINESMQQPQEKPKSAEKKEEKTEAPSEKNDKPEEPKKIKKEVETKEKSPKKIIKKPQKEETKATENNKQETAKLDQKENDKDFFKVMNLKAFKNITDDVKGSTLSIRETINIQSQLKLCYRRALEESGFESKTKIVIRIEISQDGYIQNDLDEMIDIEKYNDPVYKDYKIVIDNIKRALDLCSPLRNLPIEKYDSWKEIILQFDVGKDAN